MADEPQPIHASDLDERFRHNLAHLSREIARLEQVLAALIFVFFDDGNSLPETCAVQEALASWAMQTFDLDSLLESLDEYREPFTAPPVHETNVRPEAQRSLFPRDDPPDGTSADSRAIP